VPTRNSKIDDLLIAFGKIQATLDGLREQARQHHGELMRRMDDLDKAAHQRMDGIEDRVEVLEHDNKRNIRQAGMGAIGGALVTGLIELLKYVK